MGRIVYIDSLKGLAILSVIVSHVSVFLLVSKINLLSTFVGVYMMPLFFVLSGLVITEYLIERNLFPSWLAFYHLSFVLACSILICMVTILYSFS